MKNITFSADEHAIQRARQAALSQKRTLNDAFREWLLQFGAESDVEAFRDLMKSTRHIKLGGPYTREEMHER